MLRRAVGLAWKVVKVSFLLGVLAIGLMFASLWVEHRLALELPRPGGPYAVGRTSVAWVDDARDDPFAPVAAKRELLAWIWYPAEPSGAAKPAEYVPASWAAALDEHSDPFLSTFLWRDPAGVRCHSLQDPGLSRDRATWPVVIFRSGIGAAALDYSAILEDLASRGYVVVGADAPYSTTVVVMPDGRVILRNDAGNPGDLPLPQAELDRRLEALVTVWSADTRFLLDQVAALNAADPEGRFTGRIDLGHVGVAGHSFGGATAAQACRDDARFLAGLDLDGAPYGPVVGAGLPQPFLFLLSDHGDEWNSPDCDICDRVRAIARSGPGEKQVVTLLGAHHFSFGDAALIQSRILRSTLAALGGPGGLDPRTGLASTSRYLGEFFDVHLRGAPGGALSAGPLVEGARVEAY